MASAGLRERLLLRRISELLYRWANGWLIVAVLLVDGVITGVALPSARSAMSAGRAGIYPLDLMVFATPDRLFEMVERYGAPARLVYRTMELTTDLLHLVAYVLALALTMSWLFERGCTHGSLLRCLNVVPLGAGLLDVLENLCIVVLLSIFPSRPGGLAWLLVFLITGKWLVVGASIVLIAVGLVRAARNGFARPMAATSPP